MKQFVRSVGGPEALKREALEREADALLRRARAREDRERPAYTERQLARHGERADLCRLAQMECRPAQSVADELRFLASVTPMESEDRRCLRLWLNGLTQTEIAEACSTRQQFVSRRLHAALRACYDASPISFRRYSEHTIYRAPHRRREPGVVRFCQECGEEYSGRWAPGRFCSQPCHERAKSKGRA